MYIDENGAADAELKVTVEDEEYTADVTFDLDHDGVNDSAVVETDDGGHLAFTDSNGDGGGGDGTQSGSGAGESCRVNSFTPETKVLMADGTTKPIKDVKPGDKVVAKDPETGKTAVKKVTAQIIGKGKKNLVEVTIDTDGKKGAKTAKATATDGHPFWVPELLFKRDVFPGNVNNQFQVTIEEEGRYVGRCAELCGTYHSMMNFELVSVSPEKYEQYLAALKSGKTQPEAMEAIGFTGENSYAVTTQPFETKRDSKVAN